MILKHFQSIHEKLYVVILKKTYYIQISIDFNIRTKRNIQNIINFFAVDNNICLRLKHRKYIYKCHNKSRGESKKCLSIYN